jgi:spore coat polysaccharide biosynthesis protein SpsF
MKHGVIIAARLNSRRLPGKALLPLLDLPVLTLVLRRIKTSQMATDVILATTTNRDDDSLEAVARQEGAKVYRGSENDVLGRFVRAARMGDFEYVVRVTADCPFVGGPTLDFVLRQSREIGAFDLLTTKPAYPPGMDYEVYNKALLEVIDQRPDVTAEDREHMLNYVYRHEERYRIVRVKPPSDLAVEKDMFLLDTPQDYERLKRLVRGITDIHISAADLVERSLRAA